MTIFSTVAFTKLKSIDKMKNVRKYLLLPIAILILHAGLAKAQVPYACITKGATLEYAIYNETDELQGYTRQVVKEVSDLSNGSYDLRVENSKIKKPGQKKSGDDAYVTISEIREGCVQAYPNDMDGAVNIIEGTNVLQLPAKLAVGYQLPIGDVRLDASGMAAVAMVTENEIIGREETTTPAGTFKCYVLKQTISTTVMGFGSTTTTKSWYSRGVGIVKTETMMAGRLVQRMELVNFNKEATNKK